MSDVTALMLMPAQELRQHDRLVRRGRTQEVADVLVSNCVYVSFFDGSTETFRIGETVDIQRGGLR